MQRLRPYICLYIIILKNMRIFLITLLITAVTFGGCKKKNQENYVLFGHFYGFCQGEKCIEIFKLTDEKLYEDRADKYPSRTEFYVGTYDELDAQKFNDTKDLMGSFPTDLLNEKEIVLGQPDAGDQGGLYIEYYKNGVHKFWLLDNNKNAVSSKYHSFMDKVKEKVDKLQ